MVLSSPPFVNQKKKGASLIPLKFYIKTEHRPNKGLFIIYFYLYNIVFPKHYGLFTFFNTFFIEARRIFF